MQGIHNPAFSLDTTQIQTAFWGHLQYFRHVVIRQLFLSILFLFLSVISCISFSKLCEGGKKPKVIMT